MKHSPAYRDKLAKMLSGVCFSTEYTHDELLFFSGAGIMNLNYEAKHTISFVQH